jgi:membrane protease YdiL (CAAX protease family)
MLILAVVIFLLWRNVRAAEQRDESAALMTDRLVVGLADVLHQRGPRLLEAIQRNEEHPSWSRRLRLAVIAGEVSGPKNARDELPRLGHRPGQSEPTTDKDVPLAELLDKLYSGYEKGEKSDALAAREREELKRELGWWGELALVAPEANSDPAVRAAVLAPARRAIVVWLSFVAVLILLGLIGLALGVLLLVLWLNGRLRSGLGSPGHYGGVYAETFAVYLLLFIGLGLVLGRFFARDDGWAPLRSGVAALLGLAALAWPVIRGVPWQRVRWDIGWVVKRPVREVGIGLGTYAGALPLVFFGVMMFIGITMVQRRLGMPVEPPSHPIVGWLVHASFWTRLQLVVDACIIAPLVEETMFRGVLYRHLRDFTGKFGVVLSVLASALVSSLIFAMIHPQGIAFVPVLGALAFAFALVREWRGALLAPMIAHGVNNFVLMVVLVQIVG